MLGYVKAYKPDLKMSEYEMYRGVYCSLCKNLGRRYSPLAQLFLSFDFTLAALITLALRDEKCRFLHSRCPYNPAKKCLKCAESSLLDSCADAVIITVYYKLLDNLHDKGVKNKILSALVFPFVALMHKKAKRLSPETDAVTKAAIEKQSIAEKKNAGIDEAAEPSARALADIFSFGLDGDDKLIVSTLGYMVGRFVYILDAVDDLEKDVKSGDFNPFAGEISNFDNKSEKQSFAEKARQMLNLTQSEAVAAFDLLEAKRFGSIISNIIYKGLELSANEVLSKYTASDCKNKKEISV